MSGAKFGFQKNVPISGVVLAYFGDALGRRLRQVSRRPSRCVALLSARRVQRPSFQVRKQAWQLDSGGPFYQLLALGSILFLCIFFSPKLSNSLSKFGARVPGVSTNETTWHVDRIVRRLTFVNVTYLGCLFVIPQLLVSGIRVHTLPWIGPILDRMLPRFVTEGLGIRIADLGVIVMIVVAVAVDTVRRIYFASETESKARIRGTDKSWRHLFDGTLGDVEMARAFLSAHDIGAYSTRPMSDPTSFTHREIRISLHVDADRYREAMEMLVYFGCVDGRHHTNAASIVLGREVRDLLPRERRNSIRQGAIRLQRAEVRQFGILLIGILSTALAFSLGSPGASIAGAVVLLCAVTYMRLDKGQTELRNALRAASLPPAEVVIELAKKGSGEYAVFLRSFGVFRDWLDSEDSYRGMVIDPYESRILDAIRYGASLPAVALTDPGVAEVPVVGACRFSTKTDEDWTKVVSAALDGACLIVVHLTRISPSLELELDMIRKQQLMSRTVFVVGSDVLRIPLIVIAQSGDRDHASDRS